jgi:hypothetical protein
MLSSLVLHFRRFTHEPLEVVTLPLPTPQPVAAPPPGVGVQVEADTLHCVAVNSCSLQGVQLTVKFDGDARPPLPALGPADEAALRAWATATAGMADSGPNNGASGVPVIGSVAGAQLAPPGELVTVPRVHSAADIATCRNMLKRYKSVQHVAKNANASPSRACCAWMGRIAVLP